LQYLVQPAPTQNSFNSFSSLYIYIKICHENKEGLTRKAPETSQACMQKRELRCRTCSEALHLSLIRSTSNPVISQIYWEIFVKDSETYCKASLAISPINFWAAMDTNLVLHIDNHEYQHS
jgi:hypothetical protein